MPIAVVIPADVAAMRRVPRRGARFAFTLLELMIVLAVLAGVLTLAWPTIRRSLRQGETLQAAQTVARDVAQARFLAMERGEAYAVGMGPGQDEYLVGPWRAVATRLAAEGDVSADVGNGADAEPTSASIVETRSLPRGTRWSRPAPPQSSDLSLIENSPAGAKPPLVFRCFPSGKCDSLELHLVGDDGGAVALRVHSLTGQTEWKRLGRNSAPEADGPEAQDAVEAADAPDEPSRFDREDAP